MTTDDLVKEHWSAKDFKDFKRVKNGWDVPIRRPRHSEGSWLWLWWSQSAVAKSGDADATATGLATVVLAATVAAVVLTFVCCGCGR